MNSQAPHQLRFEFIQRRQTIAVSVAARLAEVSPECIRKWCEAGTIKAYKLVGRWRIDRGALIDFLSQAEAQMDAGSTGPTE